MEIFNKNTLYHGKEDFVFRSRYRRLTFGNSMYAKKRISILSRLRLIWVAYFTQLGGTFRQLAYVELYCQRRTKTFLRNIQKQKTIEWDDPKYADIVSSIIAEKALLDQNAELTGQKFIN